MITSNCCFVPGQVWRDTDGQPIQAHGGGILYDRGTYYWFGENKDGDTSYPPHALLQRVDVVGVSCYSSADLVNWKNEGLALPAVPDDPAHDLHPSKILERPKVVRSPSTGRYVMWVHVDTADYEYGRAGVAVSDRPAGPYNYLGSLQPDGADCRDLTVFQDSDGQAYLVFASERNRALRILPLAPDCLRPLSSGVRVDTEREREAPAMFGHRGHYHLITSGCTGWDANQAECAVADTPLGPWTFLGSPCQGPGAEITFGAQGTFALPVAGRPGAFIFMADRWCKEDLRASRYAWLPIRVQDSGISIPWLAHWDLGVFDAWSRT